MDAVKGRPFEYVNVPIRVHDNGGGFDADDISGGGGGGDETMSSAEEMSAPMVTPVNSHPLLRLSASRTSELTISFEGEVYVFPAVTPEKVSFLCCNIFCSLLVFTCGFQFSVSIY